MREHLIRAVKETQTFCCGYVSTTILEGGNLQTYIWMFYAVHTIY